MFPFWKLCSEIRGAGVTLAVLDQPVFVAESPHHPVAPVHSHGPWKTCQMAMSCAFLSSPVLTQVVGHPYLQATLQGGMKGMGDGGCRDAGLGGRLARGDQPGDRQPCPALVLQSGQICWGWTHNQLLA